MEIWNNYISLISHPLILLPSSHTLTLSRLISA